MTQTVLILGASGKIGRAAVPAFAAAGWTVRLYDRKSGDMTRQAQGADVIVNGLNPPAYHDWARLVPAITDQVIAAARASGATVIVPGNVYNFGHHPGLLSATTPQHPHTRKGRVRVQMEQTYAASGVQTIVLRAGHFVEPQGKDDSMALMQMRAVRRGRITTAGDPDVVQTYAYLPDWAQAAVMLADKRAALGVFTDIPFAGHALTVNDLRRCIAQATGRPMRLAHFPWWMITALSPIWELARELREMRYLYDMPHRLDGTRLSSLLPDFRATDLRKVMLAGLPADLNPDKVVRTSGQPVTAK